VTQLGFDLTPPPVTREVPETSRAVYKARKKALDARGREVLAWLTWYQANAARMDLPPYPTSRELVLHAPEAAAEYETEGPVFTGTDLILYVRRGLSDLKTLGQVAKVIGGDRKCLIGQHTCQVWKVVEAGR
jgi:hypothetical protein